MTTLLIVLAALDLAGVVAGIVFLRRINRFIHQAYADLDRTIADGNGKLWVRLGGLRQEHTHILHQLGTLPISEQGDGRGTVTPTGPTLLDRLRADIEASELRTNARINAVMAGLDESKPGRIVAAFFAEQERQRRAKEGNGITATKTNTLTPGANEPVRI